MALKGYGMKLRKGLKERSEKQSWPQRSSIYTVSFVPFKWTFIIRARLEIPRRYFY
jgi:hypothetical protein